MMTCVSNDADDVLVMLLLYDDGVGGEDHNNDE